MAPVAVRVGAGRVTKSSCGAAGATGAPKGFEAEPPKSSYPVGETAAMLGRTERAKGQRDLERGFSGLLILT